MRSGLLRRTVGCGLLWAALASVLLAGDGSLSQIFFSKSFPGSKPDYFEVIVNSRGEVSYREAVDDEDPIVFSIDEHEYARLLTLAEKLDFFRQPLASKLKVAFTGQKTLRFEGEGVGGEAKFVHSQNPDASALVEWFERVAETERYRIELERATQFDPLGVNKALLLFQTSFEKGRVVGAEQFIPILTKIASDQKYLHMARARASSLIERIEAGE